MSVCNDIDWDQKRNEDVYRHNSTFVASCPILFPEERWMFLGPRHEAKWYGSTSLTVTMTMTMTHSEKSQICRMKAWPYRQECRGRDPTKKESVVLLKLAHWQGVHVQTVVDSVQSNLS